MAFTGTDGVRNILVDTDLGKNTLSLNELKNLNLRAFDENELGQNIVRQAEARIQHPAKSLLDFGATEELVKLMTSYRDYPFQLTRKDVETIRREILLEMSEKKHNVKLVEELSVKLKLLNLILPKVEPPSTTLVATSSLLSSTTTSQVSPTVLISNSSNSSIIRKPSTLNNNNNNKNNNNKPQTPEEVKRNRIQETIKQIALGRIKPSSTDVTRKKEDKTTSKRKTEGVKSNENKKPKLASRHRNDGDGVGEEEEKTNGTACPVCGVANFSVNDQVGLNKHIDRCLRRTSSEVKKTTEPSKSSSSSSSSSEEEQEEEEARSTTKRKVVIDSSDESSSESSSSSEAAYQNLQDCDSVPKDDYNEASGFYSRLRVYYEECLLYGGAWSEEEKQDGWSEEELHLKCEAAVTDLKGETAAASASGESEEDLVRKTIQRDCYKSISPRFQVPRRIYYKLLDYQKETLPWFWGLHERGVGGILGDEMGLGKTVQLIAFLACLKCSQLLSQPAIIVTPATTISQWLSEINTWYAPLKVFVLHQSMKSSSNRFFVPENIINDAFEERADVIITTYSGLRLNKKHLIKRSFSYVVLDEGHHIRNPDADVTLTCKQLNTFHRIVLTGAPIQNRLKELWSIFDFIYPGLLGTLPMFEENFERPIRRGSFANSSPQEVFGAFQSAQTLRDEVKPFILRRMKKDVAKQLPEKTEQILFCNLTPQQREAYLGYLDRSDVREMLDAKSLDKNSKGVAFKTIVALQKICNHPSLVDSSDDAEEAFHLVGETEEEDALIKEATDQFAIEKSGKMMVLRHILKMWKEQGHKVLLFCQGVQMLNLVEAYLVRAENYPYLRMDGATSIEKRQKMINRFNRGDLEDSFVFLLTTRVGGVGVNLTGATRVVLFDPDWNPSTDIQARERAWRIGQTKPVTIYRLITSGTIEEKIYHRQIFKQFLTNKILADARQDRFFKYDSLKDLFTLDEGEESTETGELFKEGVINKDNSAAHSNHDESNTSVLEGLFDATSFKEVVSHNVIEKAGMSRKESKALRAQAKAVASRALEKFKKERGRLLSSSSAIGPTWTGKNGMRGAPALSSASLLDRIKNGDKWMVSVEEEAKAEDDVDDLLRQLRSLLARSGERGVKTALILEKFSDTFDDPVVFREVLRAIANFKEKQRVWVLKKKFA